MSILKTILNLISKVPIKAIGSKVKENLVFILAICVIALCLLLRLADKTIAELKLENAVLIAARPAETKHETVVEEKGPSRKTRRWSGPAASLPPSPAQEDPSQAQKDAQNAGLPLFYEEVEEFGPVKRTSESSAKTKAPEAFNSKTGSRGWLVGYGIGTTGDRLLHFGYQLDRWMILAGPYGRDQNVGAHASILVRF